MHRFIRAERANHSVTTLCRVLGRLTGRLLCSPEACALARSLEDKVIAAAIPEIHADSRQTYGAPRVQAMLARREIHVARKRVARLMRAEGLSGLIRRKRGPTTVRVPGVATAPDLVRREWNPTEPNRLWVADITYCRSWEGWLYLAAVIDCHSRKVVGWSFAQRPAGRAGYRCDRDGGRPPAPRRATWSITPIAALNTCLWPSASAARRPASTSR